MPAITLTASPQYQNLTSITGIVSTNSIVLENISNHTVYVLNSATQPVSSTYGDAITPLSTVVIAADTNPVWIISDHGGPIVVQSLPKALADYSVVDFPAKMYTSEKEGYRRIRADQAQTGFFEGREFRSFYEFTLASGASAYLRFTSPVDFILYDQTLTVDAGAVRFSAMTGGTPAGTYSTLLPVIGKNRMAARPTPYYTAQATVDTGGTHSGGTVVEVLRVVCAAATAQQTSVGAQIDSERGLPAGTYYLRLENLHNGDTKGVYSIFWEERP